MGAVRFPEATAFDGYDRAITKEQALKVLEEAAELVEAVKRCETWRVAERDAPFPSAREDVIDEAMDVYQALANLLAGEFTDGEIADAYGRCLERNRRRGRL